MSTLHQIGARCGTDRCDVHHRSRIGSYLDVYDDLFKHLRHQSFTMLEIGVRDGASMVMFAEFFPHATIVGLDILPGCKKFEKGRVKIRIGSQDDEAFLRQITDEFAPFQIIIDDGSHINSLTLQSFAILKNFLTKTGVYVIEDLANSYNDLRTEAQNWPGIKQQQLGDQLDNSKTRKMVDQLILQSIKDMDLNPMDSFFKRIQFVSRIAIFEK